ncbi:MAG: Gfo/Idh/MocA family protein [Gemmatimonadaceae bacterium]
MAAGRREFELGPPSRTRHKPLRLAFLGCGRATAELHLPALRHVPEFAVVELSDHDAARAAILARRFSVQRLQRSLAEICADSNVDAVAVCTPPDAHAESAVAALDAGKHLFVEKPLALTLADCDRIVAAGERARGAAVVGFNLRRHRLLRAARTVIEQGVLGRIELVRSLFTSDIRLTRTLPAWRDEPARGGGVLNELATHHFDLWRWLLRAEADEVFALGTGGVAPDDTALVSARLSGGILATAQLCERTTPLNQLDILGEHGRLRISLYDFDGIELVPLTRRFGSIAGRLRPLRRMLTHLPAGLRGMLYGGDYVRTYRDEWRSFAQTILRGSPATATLHDGRAASRIAIAAAESAMQGRPVRL